MVGDGEMVGETQERCRWREKGGETGRIERTEQKQQIQADPGRFWIHQQLQAWWGGGRLLESAGKRWSTAAVGERVGLTSNLSHPLMCVCACAASR